MPPRQAVCEEEGRSALPRGNTPGRRPFSALLAPGVAMSTESIRGRGSGGTSRVDRAPPTRARPAARPPEEGQTSKPRRNIASRGNHRRPHDEAPHKRKASTSLSVAHCQRRRTAEHGGQAGKGGGEQAPFHTFRCEAPRRRDPPVTNLWRYNE